MASTGLPLTAVCASSFTPDCARAPPPKTRTAAKTTSAPSRTPAVSRRSGPLASRRAIPALRHAEQLVHRGFVGRGEWILVELRAADPFEGADVARFERSVLV